MKVQVQQVLLSDSHRSQLDEIVVLQAIGEKDDSEKPAPAEVAELVESGGPDGHPIEHPIVVTNKREAHDAEEYDERAAKFWSVYVGEAESHDKALVETWKDDMEGIIIFVRFPVLYPAS